MVVVHHIRTTPDAFRLYFTIAYYDLSSILIDFQGVSWHRKNPKFDSKKRGTS